MTTSDPLYVGSHLNSLSLEIKSTRIFRRPVSYAGARAEVPLGADAQDLAAHRETWGSPILSVADFVHAVSGSDLTGRGGAHIPVTWKLDAAREAGPGGTVVVNGAEGEPGSAKDAALLQLRPHLVIDGALAVAEAIEAREVVLWVHESATATRARVADAVRERGTELPVSVRMLLAPDGYVGGEASAVISAVGGGPALPAHSVDRARPWGDGAAVLVHNAETHARLGMLSLGHDPVETSLVTVAESSAPLRFTRRTVVEVHRLQTFASVLSGLGVTPPRAVLLGGMGGTWVEWRDLADLPMDPQELRRRGLSLGAGIIHLLPEGRDGLAESAAILDRLAVESARQCGPCVFGLPSLAASMHQAVRARRGGLLRRPSPRHDHKVVAASDLVVGRGACRHPDGAARMAMSAVEVFGS
jgi:NADH:ubiquinone oxidoreductase subunit F (NADH-binding)